MPPRLMLQPPVPPSTTSLLAILPYRSSQCSHLQQPHRCASILASLSDVPAAYHKRIRRGRGASSGKGKTSGRGHKGQKQHGKTPFRSHLGRFNGGQTPVEWVHGKRGFTNQFSVDMTPVNLDKIQSWINQGRLDARHPITIRELALSRCVSSIKDGVKLLAKNADTLTAPVHIIVSRASASAIKAIESAGGSVQTRYYTPESIQRVIRGDTHPTLSLLSPPPPSPPPSASFPAKAAGPSESGSLINDPSSTSIVSAVQAHLQSYKYRLPDPTSRKDIEYYRDPAHRGYLSHQLQVGQGPSLYFKTPAEVATALARRKVVGGGGAENGAKQGDNKIW